MRARFTLHEEITVDSVNLLSGETIRVHLPLPIVGNQVVSARLLKTSHTPASVAPEDHTARTAFFELPYQPGMTVSADFEYEIDAPYVEQRGQ